LKIKKLIWLARDGQPFFLFYCSGYCRGFSRCFSISAGTEAPTPVCRRHPVKRGRQALISLSRPYRFSEMSNRRDASLRAKDGLTRPPAPFPPPATEAVCIKAVLMHLAECSEPTADARKHARLSGCSWSGFKNSIQGLAAGMLESTRIVALRGRLPDQVGRERERRSLTDPRYSPLAKTAPGCGESGTKDGPCTRTNHPKNGSYPVASARRPVRPMTLPPRK
jgi:hypothetical protein